MTALDTAIALLETERADLADRLAAVDTAIASLRALDARPAAVTVTPGRSAGPVRTVPLHFADPEPHRKTADLPDPRTVQPLPRPSTTAGRRRFKAAEKQAGADLARRIGVAAAAAQLGVDLALVEGWVRWFPAADSAGRVVAGPARPEPGPSTGPAPTTGASERPADPGPSLQPAAQAGRSSNPSTLTFVPQPEPDTKPQVGGQAGWGDCTCGARFGNREEWGRHNSQITERATGPADLKAHRLTVHYGITG